MLLPNGLLPGIVFVEAQFIVPGVFDECGVNTAAMGESYANQTYISTVTMYKRMTAAGRATSNGVTTMGKIVAQLQADGVKISRNNGSKNWKSWAIARLKEGATVAYEPAYGQVLHDEITGQGMDASNLHYHFNLFVGYWPGGYNDKAGKNLAEGFWVADGANNANNVKGPDTQIINGRSRVVNGRRPQFYAAANIQASQPYDFTAIYPKVQIGVQLLTTPDAKYAGWRYDPAANKLYAPGEDPQNSQNYFEKGFAGHVWAEILAGHWRPDQVPMGREFVVSQVEEANHVWGNGSIIFLRYGYLAWSEPKNVIYEPWSGQELRYFRQQLKLPYQAA